jgi:hypothetical protein
MSSNTLMRNPCSAAWRRWSSAWPRRPRYSVFVSVTNGWPPAFFVHSATALVMAGGQVMAVLPGRESLEERFLELLAAGPT